MANILITVCPTCGKTGENKVTKTFPTIYTTNLLDNMFKDKYPNGIFRRQTRQCLQCWAIYDVVIIPQYIVHMMEQQILKDRERIQELEKKVDQLTPKMRDTILSKAKKREQLPLLDNVPTIPVKHKIDQYYPPIPTRRD